MTEFVAALQHFHFLRPWWLAAVVAPLLCLWLPGKPRRSVGAWGGVIASELLPFLVVGKGRPGLDLRLWLLAAAVITCLALAGPTWSKQPTHSHRQERALVVMFDLSPSMLAADLVPDRLTRARLKITDLLKAHREGSVGLVAYAGDAHVVSPLTDDTNTIVHLLPVLHPDLMPAAGSSPEAAVNLALELALNAGHLDGDLLLVSDGMTRDAREAIAATLRGHPGFRLSIIGVGSDDGAPIPVGEQGFARDGSGAIVIARLRSAELRGLAERSGGIYRSLTASDVDIDAVLGFLSTGAGGEMRQLERDLDTWQDRGPWVALLLVPLAALMFRRGLFLGLLLIPLSHAPHSRADLWQDLWWSKDQQGLKALDRGDHQLAREHFEDPGWRGIAASRAGDHAAAAEAFAAMAGADGHYNRGNALAKLGDLEGAIEAYDQALALAPQMADAAYNKALVEQLKNQEQQEQQEQGGSSSPQPQDGDRGQQQSRDMGSKPQRPSDAGGDRAGAGDDPGPPAGGADPGETAADRETVAEAPGAGETPPPGETGGEDTATGSTGMDGTPQGQSDAHWLRRVPDDPGGLLRRKFEYQARQRFRDEGRSPRPPPGQFQEERW